MKKLILLIVLVSSLFAKNNWSFVNSLDDFTDKKVQYISYEDKDHKFQMRDIDGILWLFIIRKKSGNPYKLNRYYNDFVYKDTKVYFRVDKNDLYILDVGDVISFKINLERTLNKPLDRWAYIDHNTIAFNILTFIRDGKYKNHDLKITEFLTCDMYKGKYLKIKYETDSIEDEAFKIPLKGFKSAFEKAFDKDSIPNCK